MRGIPTFCCFCGQELEKFGSPTFYDICANDKACRQRLYSQKEFLRKQLLEIKNKLEERVTQ